MTGAGGFIGAHLCRQLLEAGARVHALLRPGTARHPRGVDSVPVDCADHASLREALGAIAPRHVFHAACHSAYDKSVTLRRLVADDVLSTANLLDCAEELKIPRVVVLGGSLEYRIQARPIHEDDDLSPVTLRGASRAASSLMALAAARHRGVDCVLIRPFSVFGPGEPAHRLIPRAISCALSGEELPLTAGEIRHDFVHVHDVAAACLLAALSANAGQVFNIGSGVGRTNDEVVAAVEAVTGRVVRVARGAYPAHAADRPHWCADLTRARRELGWQPALGFEAGLAQTLSEFPWT